MTLSELRAFVCREGFRLWPPFSDSEVDALASELFTVCEQDDFKSADAERVVRDFLDRHDGKRRQDAIRIFRWLKIQRKDIDT